MPAVAGSAAGLASADDNEPVAVDAESPFPSDGIADFGKLVTVKLKELVADLAVQMIVLRIAVVMFVNGTPPQVHLT